MNIQLHSIRSKISLFDALNIHHEFNFFNVKDIRLYKSLKVLVTIIPNKLVQWRMIMTITIW